MKQIKIGKASTNDVVIKDNSVSREHLEVFIDSYNNVFVTDLDSTNGTFVNGNRIEKSVKLETLDVLKVGNSLVQWPRFLIEDDNLNEVYETLTETPTKLNNKFDSNIILSKIKRTNKYFFIGIFIIIFLSVFAAFGNLKNNSKNRTILEVTDNETSIELIQQQKQRINVSYDFSCLSNNEDLGSNDVIYNFGELTRDIQSTFFNDIDISVKNEQDTGNKILSELKKEHDFISKGNDLKNLNSILQNLVSRLSKPRGFNYKIYLVDDPMINAMTAGGYIFIFKGIYDFCESNSELAAIISHEIAHNELGHLTLNLKKQKAASDWGIFGEIILEVENLTTQSFNQKQESEADLFGMDIVYPTSFRNCDAIKLWKRMSENESKFDLLNNFFRSHPYSENRSKCIRNHLISNYNKNCN